MASNHSEISIIDVPLAELPKSFKKSVGGRGATLLIGSESPKEARLIAKVAKAAAGIMREHRKAMAETRIETLVDLYLEGEPLAQVDEDLELDNAVLHAQYLKQVPCYSAAEIRAQQSRTPPRNPSEPTSRWKREGKIFAIPHGKSDRFPAFQFDHGAPLPAIKKILAVLPEDMTPWQIALWFASGNGWLDGSCPQASLSNVDDVLEAARQLDNSAVG